ncbi:MAG: adenosylcobinamide-GDP ribazoletransferase [Terracidiphilus sp.]|jgi:adenosylcobinamide-GDP ribazoletransferase
MKGILHDIAAAFQFLTRLPLNRLAYQPDALSRAAKFFPLVGLAIGVAAAGIYYLLSPHLPSEIVALLIVLFSALATGAMHEDGLADTADALGGGWDRQQALDIMKDSRIGCYGALAIVFSVAARVLLLASIPSGIVAQYLVSAEVLCRWTIVPLGAALPGARNHASQGGRIAGRISRVSLAVGTLTAFCVVACLLRVSMWKPFAAASVVTLLSGLYYRHRISGVTGDCFGATCQLTLVAVYLCGVWHG